MQENDLMWRGGRASDLGVMVSEAAPRTRPAMRVQKEVIPGHSGSAVTDLWGEDIYEDMALSVSMMIRPGYSREAVAEWLTGSGQLILGTQPQDAYHARLEEAAEIREMFPGHPDSYASVTAAFLCEPYRYEAMPMAGLQVLSGRKGVNPRNAAAKPRLTIHGKAGAQLAISCAGRVLEAELTANEAEIDCDWERAVGCRTGGAFLSLPPRAAWEIRVEVRSGAVSAIVMEPRYRSI